jgi:signal transduction histidine kinase/ActR/RegA family two-component response regulator
MSTAIDPGLIRAEPHPEVGQIIQRDAEILIERWSHRAAKEQPNAQRVHHKILVDDFHEFLRALGRSLAESDDAATCQHCLHATIHGTDRWETGWSLPEVVRDFQILRLVILDYLQEVLESPLNHRVVMAIGLALDEAVAASVTMYVKSRDESLRQLEADRESRDKEIQERLRLQTNTLREVDRRKTEFLAILGHELRNPLAPLWNAVRLLELQQTTEPTVLQVRDIITRQVQQLARLLDDLLDVSRIAQNKIILRKERVSLATIVNQAVQTSSPHLKARHHQFEVRLPAEPIWLEADLVRLVQILVNLLNNAAKYTEPGGQISLVSEREGDEVIIRVRDNGIGIPQEMLPYVFDLFTQAEWSLDHSQGGIGIGLTLVRRLVDLHGGAITVHSGGLEQGSEFIMRLPALPREIDNKETPATEAPSLLDAGVSPSRRILVVDDNVDAAETLAMLMRLSGHEVQTAHHGLAALEVARIFRPEVVLLDIGLPRLDGYEVARRLRQMPDIANALLVALTGYGQDDDRRRSQEAGFNVHLVKPLDLHKVQELLMKFTPLPATGDSSE